MNAPVESGLEHRNEIRLVGRVAAEPIATTLPSMDELVSVRLVIERPPRTPASKRKKIVDTVLCVAWTPFERRRLRMWAPGDIVEVEGSLRRRFWRTEQGPRNRYEVEVTRASCLARSSADTASDNDECE
jgi:single-strand DNA-binding protein